jgi:predicted TIM-barrel fold metal-dependent hydrolase
MIPMHDPQEAVEEIEHAVRHLGFKTVAIPSYVERPAARRGQKERWIRRNK